MCNTWGSPLPNPISVTGQVVPAYGPSACVAAPVVPGVIVSPDAVRIVIQWLVIFVLVLIYMPL